MPIYIQEKIHPQAIIDALPRIERAGDNQPNLFADFNGGPTDFAQKIDFYHHEQNWANRMGEGADQAGGDRSGSSVQSRRLTPCRRATGVQVRGLIIRRSARRT